jgi:undecaprenyl-diphosphatase
LKTGRARESDLDGVNGVLAIKAALLGLVEGLTEFLPISSTGHLILAGALLDFTGETAKTFEIAIQTGAMFAVIWEYRRRIGRTIAGVFTDASARRFALNVLIGVLPAVVLGYLFNRAIKAYLFAPVPVALAFVAGAFVILWAEARHERLYGASDTGGARRARVETVDQISPSDALKIGCAQCLALIPGTSRSGATIIGGMLFGLSRRAATEFSFYLAIPILIGAGALAVWRQRATLAAADAPLFAIGSAVAFVSALVCIRWLIRFVSSHDFRVFAWYRIVFGAVILLTAYTGWVDWAD